jgi:hypothetical protein
MKREETVNPNSIFVSQNEVYGDHINGKITFTNVVETIPECSSESPLPGWKKTKNIEWRWRFLDLPDGRHTVEISFLKTDGKSRIYFNKDGQWVSRFVHPIYDKYVTKEFYYYN